MNDSTLHEQSYAYFLQEAPQLLQILEEELLSLRAEWSMNKVHTLMRATHTLKGSAACVGLDSIRQVAHSLEDIFRHLCRPEVTLDRATEALLFEAYDCLRTPLMAEITGSHSQDAEVFDRAAAVFSELQTKLGIDFAPEVEIPNSDELGFDVTKSIFEVGVAQRLAEIDRVLASGEPETVAATLQTQAEVFLGLAESLNLPGFGAIASTAMTALANYPDRAIAIAQTALADFQQGQAIVLAGDRSGGGSPSAQLLELAGEAGEKRAEGAEEAEEAEGARKAEGAYDAEGAEGEFNSEFRPNSEFYSRTTHHSPLTTNYQLPITNPNDADSLLESIWTIAEPVDEPEAATATATTADTYSRPQEPPPSSLAKRDAAMPDTVRVNVGHLEQLNYFIGELLTNQNRQSLQDEKLQGGMQELLDLMQQQQQMLIELQHRVNLQEDPSSRLAVLAQSLLDNGEQLQATGDEIDLYSRQSSQMLEKQSRLLNSVRDEFLTARVIPISVVFDRLPPILRQLETLHDKSVAMEFSGKEVMVDKAVAEKLYDPLLHLVRNAFDHGIESKSERSQLGKAPTGRIAIRAFHQGSHLTVEIQDDGQGLNYNRIRQRAIEMGLVAPAAASNLNEVQLMDLIFEPGFSTAAQVNNLSGRGVGLDVVRAQLQSLQGAIAVYSQPQRGTTFILQIPLSLTIAKLFLCQVGSTIYALLGNAIEQIILPHPEKLRPWRGGKVLCWGEANAEQLIPVLPLKGILPYFAPLTAPADRPTVQGRIVLLRYQDQHIAVEIDQAIGEQESVIRPLDPMIVPPSYVYGGSILADGNLALAIDSTALAKYVIERQVNQVMGRAAVSTDVDNNRLSGVTPMLSTPQLQIEPTRTTAKILLVDDSFTWRQTLALTLQQAGYQVVQAGDGREAIAQMRSHPDLAAIVCDLEMPQMNGLELLHYCRQSATAHIPFAIVTANTDTENQTAAMELGVTDYINKSRSHQELLATVARLLN